VAWRSGEVGRVREVCGRGSKRPNETGARPRGALCGPLGGRAPFQKAGYPRALPRQGCPAQAALCEDYCSAAQHASA
jgi:hypothetical protein